MDMKQFIVALLFATVHLISCNNNSGIKSDKIVSDTSTPTVTYMNHAAIEDFFSNVPKDTAKPESLGTVKMITHGQGGEPYFLVRRTVPGYVELHEQWDDVAIIRSGHGILKTGSKVTGERKETDKAPWRNWFGGTITDATERRINPGDFVIIPAMTAHQYIPDINDTLTYWTIKIKRVHQ